MNTKEKVNTIIDYILAASEEEKSSALFRLKMLREEKTDARNVDESILEILSDIGVPEHILGHQYCACAIKLVVEKPDLIHSVTGNLYPTVAKMFDSTPYRIERAIRRGIESAWDRCDFDAINKYFGNTVSASRGKPTNSEFVARIANIVRRKMMA